jgi:ABC-type dipeptide/oligopeptide/nickel transport system permease subunit
VLELQPSHRTAGSAVNGVDQEHELALDDLPREQVIDWRARGAHNHQIVFDHIDRYGGTSARRLFTRTFVDQVQRLAGLGHLGLGYTTWGQA